MGMSHELCNHPRTPAGRAACRKAGGPDNSMRHANAVQATVDIRRESARKPRVTGGGRSNKAPIEIDATTRRAPEPKRTDAMQLLRKNASTSDIPRPFKSVISHAWKMGWDVRKGSPYNAGQRVITIQSDTGTASLVWKLDNPHGVTRASFRPNNTSITSVMTVNEIIRKLEGVTV